MHWAAVKPSPGGGFGAFARGVRQVARGRPPGRAVVLVVELADVAHHGRGAHLRHLGAAEEVLNRQRARRIDRLLLVSLNAGKGCGAWLAMSISWVLTVASPSPLGGPASIGS